MASSKDKFNEAVDQSIKKELEKRQSILSELVEDMHQTRETNSKPEEEQQMPEPENQEKPATNDTKPEANEEQTPDQTEKQDEQKVESNPQPKTEEKSTSDKSKKESILTGAGSASWNAQRNESWQRFSPQSKSAKGSSVTPTPNQPTNEGSMKRIVSLLIVIGAVVVFFYYWSPWSRPAKIQTTINVSNSSFLSGSPTDVTEFKPHSEIYYKISQNAPFDGQDITIEIYTVNGKKETLIRTQKETGISPKTQEFAYMLRPDFFAAPGQYRIKIYMSAKNQKKLATQKDITIK